MARWCCGTVKIPWVRWCWRSSASDPDKRSSWPLYTAALHAKHRGLLQDVPFGHRHQSADRAVVCSSRSRRVSRMRRFVRWSWVPMRLGGWIPKRPRGLTCRSRCCRPSCTSTITAGSRFSACAALPESVAGTDAAIWFYGLLRGLVDDERLTLLQEMIKMLNPGPTTNPARSGNAITTTPACR